MGGMFTIPPQMWVQPMAAPIQPMVMEVDNDMLWPWKTKLSFSSRKDKGKTKTLETFICQQRAEEAEKNLDHLLQHTEDAGVDLELAELASSLINDKVVHTLVEQLLAHIDMLWDKKWQVEQALI